MASRIVFVDDDEATRLAMVEILTHAGYTTKGVGSLPEAQEAVRTFAPDLLITDIRLGQYNGLQLVVMEAPIRAIVITGFRDPVLEAEARAHGASVLIKPVDPAMMLATVQDVLARPRPAPRRRWRRKRVTHPLSADLGGTAARVVDISYGGVCVELTQVPARRTPQPFTMAIADLRVPVDVVWEKSSADQSWTWGLAVQRLDAQVANAWFELVDAAV